jgi:calcineurin-like phosphoesterase family protein
MLVFATGQTGLVSREPPPRAAGGMDAEGPESATLMTVLFTADTHFGHAGALGLYRRPFASLAATDAALIEGWNRAVAPTDEVYHLGDFAMTSKREPIEALLSALHGGKHLITGNNDRAGTCDARGWSTVQSYLELDANGVLLVLCHYALRTWRDIAKGALNLHGHSHGRLKPLLRQYDVGVDVCNYRPVSLDVLLAGRRPPASRKAVECQPRRRRQ